MVHSGATGLTDDWRTKIQSPYSAVPHQPLTPDLQTPDHNMFQYFPMTPTPMTPLSPLSSLSVRHLNIHPVFHSKTAIQFGETPLPVFTLPRIVKGSKVYPGIKDLPPHIRQDFRNEFIRVVIKQVANSQSPWMNPDVESLQATYQVVYPIFPARIRHSDAVYHPVSNISSIILYNADTSQDRLITWSPP